MGTNYRTFTFCFLLLVGFAPVALGAEEVPALVQSCAACHGENGIAPAEQWPNLAGQKQGYLARQIKAFRDGQRENPLMLPLVQNLSDEQITQLADYYASLPAPEWRQDEANELGRNARARCISCHGREGVTVNPEWPNLTGQNAEYLQQQLLDYRSGKRKHLLMQVIANELTKEEIEAVATYF
jgi:cytochrome c553